MTWMYFSQWKLHSNRIIFQLQFAKKLSHFTSCDKIVTKTNCNEIWWIIIFFFFYMQGYQNCSCFVTQSNEGIEGSGCQPECNNLAPFLFCLFGLMVFTFSNNIPATTATLRYNLWFLKKSIVVRQSRKGGGVGGSPLGVQAEMFISSKTIS